MYNVRKVVEDLYYVGSNDRQLKYFENEYPLDYGMSFNSYLLKDEKNVLLDTVDWSIGQQFIENVEYVLDGEDLDILIMHHMEPDHCGTLQLILDKYPNIKIYGNIQVCKMIKQFYGLDVSDKFVGIKEGDELDAGKHKFKFIAAPFVHWPEVMMSYEESEKLLFSADAFGKFGALNGNLFDDEADIWKNDIDECRRYYCNIVGKYGAQTQTVLKKVSTYELKMILPLHGPVLRNDLTYCLDKYNKWSTYEPEEESVLIVCGSIYGGSENAAEIMANLLAQKGVKNIKICDVNQSHVSYLVAQAFKYRCLLCVSVTQDNNLYAPMKTFLEEIKNRNLANRKFAFIENGTWAPMANKLMKAEVEGFKNSEFIEPNVTLLSAVNETNLEKMDELATAIVNAL